MNQPEMLTVGKALLAEYEPTLKVLGEPVTPFGSPEIAKVTIRGTVQSMDEKEIRHEISKVLDQLAALKNGFRLSVPDPVLKSLYKVDTVIHGNLMLSFVTMYDASKLEAFTHVVCWYYPV
jgi:hypothetical protein